MTVSLDIFLIPLTRRHGQLVSEPLNYIAALPPRGAKRSRHFDRLVAQLTFDGAPSLTDEAKSSLLAYLVKTYFKASGSATSVMRNVAEALNRELLSWNRKRSGEGEPTFARLSLAVLKDRHLYLMQSGDAHAYLLQPDGVKHFHEDAFARRGLGLAKTAPYRFYQATINSSDMLLITPDAPEIWTEDLLTRVRRGLATDIRAALFPESVRDCQALFIKMRTGTGQIRVVSWQKVQPRKISASRAGERRRANQPSALEKTPDPVIRDSGVEDIPKKPEEHALPNEPFADMPSVSPDSAEPLSTGVPSARKESAPADYQKARTAPSQFSGASAAGRRDARRPGAGSRRMPGNPAGTGNVRKHTRVVRRKSAVDSLREKVLPRAEKTFVVMRSVLKDYSRELGSFLKRMLPDESLFTIPSSVMLTVALAVPVFVVALASIVYFQRGRGAIYNQNFNLAQEAAQVAVDSQDPILIREKWISALTYLDKAEKYKETKESKTLRDYANKVLDQMDIVYRIDYIPALTERLPKGTVISRIVVSDKGSDKGDLYLLNDTDGNVFHAKYAAQEYTLDQNFLCGPINASVSVGPLVDIALLPKVNHLNAKLIGIDREGHVIGCEPGSVTPFIEKLAAPNGGWGMTASIAVDESAIYVLDTVKNNVWIFWGTDSLKSPPTAFFTGKTANLTDGIDMIVHDGDLFLLHADGTIAMCSLSRSTQADSKCTDPVLIADPRPGFDNKPTIDDAVFSGIQFLPPPDPSVYLLDAEQQTVYHFSLRMRYLDRIRPHNITSRQPATAFTVSKLRMIYLALKDKVYFAPLP